MTTPTVEETTEHFATRLRGMYQTMEDEPDQIVRGMQFHDICMELNSRYEEGVKAERERVKKDIDEIWGQCHINNNEDDGFRDSKQDVIEKVFYACKKQMEYLNK